MSLGKEFCEANPSFYLKLVLHKTTDTSSPPSARIVLLKHLVPEGGSLSCEAIAEYAKGLVTTASSNPTLEPSSGPTEDSRVSMTYQDMEGDDIPIACTQELEDAISILVAQDRSSESKRGHLKLKVRITAPTESAVRSSCSLSSPDDHQKKRKHLEQDQGDTNEPKQDSCVYVGDTSSSLAKRARGGAAAVQLNPYFAAAVAREHASVCGSSGTNTSSINNNAAAAPSVLGSNFIMSSSSTNGSYAPFVLAPNPHLASNSGAPLGGYYSTVPVTPPPTNTNNAPVPPPSQGSTSLAMTGTVPASVSSERPASVRSTSKRGTAKPRKPAAKKAGASRSVGKMGKKAMVSGNTTGERICNSLLELHELGITEPCRSQVALFAGYSNCKSAGFAKALTPLKQQNLVESPPGGKTLKLTEHALSTLKRVEAPQDNAMVQARMCEFLSGKGNEIFRELQDGKVHSREAVAMAVGYTNPKSAGFPKALQQLSRLNMLEYPDRQTLRLTEIVFPYGRPTEN